jgi:hypothetical protein
MISGQVNAFREAVVRIPVRSLAGQEQTIEVVIDFLPARPTSAQFS